MKPENVASGVAGEDMVNVSPATILTAPANVKVAVVALAAKTIVPMDEPLCLIVSVYDAVGATRHAA